MQTSTYLLSVNVTAEVESLSLYGGPILVFILDKTQADLTVGNATAKIRFREGNSFMQVYRTEDVDIIVPEKRRVKTNTGTQFKKATVDFPAARIKSEKQVAQGRNCHCR